MRGEFGMGNPEMREPQPLRREFEYRDVDGKLIGRAEVEMDEKEKDVPAEKIKGREDRPPIRGRVLRRFVLRGEKDGQPTETDMLALTNGRGSEIVITSERLRKDQNDFDPNDNRVTVPPPETLIDVGDFLHEMGHAAQYGETRFRTTGVLYGGERKLLKEDSFDMKELRQRVALVRLAVPEAADLLTDENLDEFETVQSQIVKERTGLETDSLKLRGASVKEKDKTRADELVRKAQELETEVHGLDDELEDLIEEFRIREFVALPTSILERDATYRALKWARKIRAGAGIDLFSKSAAANQPSAASDSTCEKSMSEGLQSGPAEPSEETGILDELRHGLDLYGADRLRLRRHGRPDDIGITPTVGRKRDRK